MATIATQLNTVFTPAVGDFIVQVTNGTARLLRRNTAGAAWAPCAPVNGSLEISGAVTINNPVTGAQYMFQSNGTPTVQADQ